MSPPAVKWKLTAIPITAKKTIVHPVYIVADVKMVLNCPASVALGLTTRVEVVSFASVTSVKQEFPQLFKGLGRLEGSIKLNLKLTPSPLPCQSANVFHFPMLPNF